jgi:N-acetylglucosaminyl-diphospho-decaprenol L-rhamnosyltransferase
LTFDLIIIIVNHNTRSDLDRCLRSLHEAPPHVPHQIVVVDNGSTDGSAELVRRSWPAVRLIEAGGNQGFARANNLAIRATTSDLVLLLNSDTIVPPGAIDRLVDELRTDPATAAIGPRIVDGQARAELSFGSATGPWPDLQQKIARRLAARGVGSALSWIDRETRQPKRVAWVTGACLLVRRADAESAGLLDERYFMYCEDMDFCTALRARGRHVRFSPSAEIVHFRGRSAAATPATAAAAYRNSQVLFYQKHHPRWLPWLKMYLRFQGKLPAESADKKGNV